MIEIPATQAVISIFVSHSDSLFNKYKIGIINAYDILLKDELSAFRVSFDRLLNKVKL